jgi:hypothetical protein
MYYDKSSFPNFLYPMEITFISIDKIYENAYSIIHKENFEDDLLRNIKNKENQDLFGYLTTILPSLIISNYRKFKREELTSSSVGDEILLQQIFNLRVDIKVIHNKISELKADNLVINDDCQNLILELNRFIFQFVFIKLTQCIVAKKINQKSFFFNIKNDAKKYSKYSSSNDKSSMDRIQAQKNFVIGYLESFEGLDRVEIKNAEQELIFISNNLNQKRRLKSIIENNVLFSESLSNKTKSNLRKYFFKEIIAKFFFKYLDDNSIDDYEVLEAFRLFQKRL